MSSCRCCDVVVAAPLSSIMYHILVRARISIDVRCDVAVPILLSIRKMAGEMGS